MQNLSPQLHPAQNPICVEVHLTHLRQILTKRAKQNRGRAVLTQWILKALKM